VKLIYFKSMNCSSYSYYTKIIHQAFLVIQKSYKAYLRRILMELNICKSIV